MDVVKKWEESGLLKGLLHKEHQKIVAMSLEGMARRLKTMEAYTPEEELYEVSILLFPIVRRLVVKARYEPITDFAGLVEKVQKEYARFSLENDMENDYGNLGAEFCAQFVEEHVGMF